VSSEEKGPAKERGKRHVSFNLNPYTMVKAVFSEKSTDDASTSIAGQDSRSDKPPAIEPGPAVGTDASPPAAEGVAAVAVPALGRAQFEGRPVVKTAMARSSTAGVVCDRADCGDFTVYAASQIGGDHETRGRFREDAYAFAPSPAEGSGICIVAVADGVSQSRSAALAADEAASTVVEALCQYTGKAGVPTPESWQQDARKIVDKLADALPGSINNARRLRLEWRVASQPKSTPATTLVFAVLVPGPTEVSIYWGGIGDSHIGIVNLVDARRNSLIYDGAPKARADTATLALPRNADRTLFGCGSLSPGDVVWLGTDGFAKAMTARPDFMAAAMADTATDPPKASDFLRMVDWRLEGANDDRTVAIVWPHS
jgi:serine/threonine protein phosphatase PrpC